MGGPPIMAWGDMLQRLSKSLARKSDTDSSTINGTAQGILTSLTTSRRKRSTELHKIDSHTFQTHSRIAAASCVPHARRPCEAASHPMHHCEVNGCEQTSGTQHRIVMPGVKKEAEVARKQVRESTEHYLNRMLQAATARKQYLLASSYRLKLEEL